MVGGLGNRAKRLHIAVAQRTVTAGGIRVAGVVDRGQNASSDRTGMETGVQLVGIRALG
jgi:hypothetical protein